MYPAQTFKLNPTGYDLQKFYRVQTPKKVDKIQECKSQSPKASKVINKVSGDNSRSASNKPRAKSREKRSNKVQKGSDNCEEVSGSDTANGGPPKQYNPNLLPIGHGFGFIISIGEIKDW